MKRIFCLLVVVCVLMAGCATTYQGFTNIRVKAKKFVAQCGPFNKFEGEDVDAHLTREMTLTNDKERKIKDHHSVKMTHTGEDSTLDVIK